MDPVAADGELIEAAAAMPDSLPEQAAAATRIAARQRGKQGRRAARARAAIYDADALPTSGVNDDEEPFDDQDEEDYPAVPPHAPKPAGRRGAPLSARKEGVLI